MKHSGILLDITLSLLRFSKMELAERLGVSQSSISGYMKKEKELPNKSAIIEILSLPSGYFDMELPTVEDLIAIGRRGKSNDIAPNLAHNNEHTGSNAPEIAALQAIIQNYEVYIADLKATIADKNKIIALLEGSGAKQSN